MSMLWKGILLGALMQQQQQQCTAELCTPGQRQDTRRDSSNSITTTTTCSRHYCPKTDATLSAEEAEAWVGEWCACGDGCMCEVPESMCGCQAGGDRTCDPGATWQVDSCTVNYCAAGAAGSPWIVLVLILGSFCVLCGIGAYKIKSGALGDLGGPGMGGPPGMGGMDSVARVEQVPDEVTQDANPSASDADKSED